VLKPLIGSRFDLAGPRHAQPGVQFLARLQEKQEWAARLTCLLIEARDVASATLDLFANDEAGQTVRPVKARQRSSGGGWRTLTGLADSAIAQSQLSAAAKWGMSKLDSLRDLFNGHAWASNHLDNAAWSAGFC
jgi:hypothetical protein